MTIFGTLLAVKAGNSGTTVVLVALAVLAGQLSIGWSNDRIDAERDRNVGRADKPLAARAGMAAVDIAIVVALAGTVAFSLALGLWAGITHLLAVACGWSYNLALKSTWISWLPFALAFGALPAVATFALPGHPAPAAWLVAAGALLGVAGHLTNTVPDLAADRANRVVGFPHRIGARPAIVLSTVLLVAATALLLVGPAGAPSVLAVVVVGAVTVAGLAVAALRPYSSWPFYAIIALVLVDLVLLVFTADASDLIG